jgi:hypothetical protein
MATFLFPRGPESYVRVFKIPIGTPLNKTVQGQSDLNYEVLLPERVDRVVGLKVVDWSFPRDLVPTFWPRTTNLAGNNRLDFRLTNADVGAPADFAVTLPTRYLDYTNSADHTRDYLFVIANTMNAAISANATWAKRVLISTVPDSRQRTLLLVATVDSTLPSLSTTTLTLLFATGPNKADAVWKTMGFDVDADVSSTTSVYALPPGVQSVLSPSAVRLRGSRFLDVIIEESPQNPVERVFFTDPSYTSNPLWSNGIFRAETDQNHPPRTLEKLRIRLSYEKTEDLGRFSGGEPIIAPHSLTIHFFCLQDSISTRPSWLQQNLAY